MASMPIATLIADCALFTSLLFLLRDKSVLTEDDMRTLFDYAMTSLEGQDADQDIDHARQLLELMFSRMMEQWGRH